MRTLLLALLPALVPAHAQQTVSPPAPVSPAMQGAIDRIIHGNPPPRIVPPGAQLTLLAAPIPPNPACAVPLLEMHIDHPEQFSMATVPPAASNDPMPSAKGIAPPCPLAASPGQ